MPIAPSLKNDPAEFTSARVVWEILGLLYHAAWISSNTSRPKSPRSVRLESNNYIAPLPFRIHISMGFRQPLKGISPVDDGF